MASEKTIMLLPTMIEARMLREALSEWISRHQESEDPALIDAAYAYQAKLSDELRRAR